VLVVLIDRRLIIYTDSVMNSVGMTGRWILTLVNNRLLCVSIYCN